MYESLLKPLFIKYGALSMVIIGLLRVLYVKEQMF